MVKNLKSDHLHIAMIGTRGVPAAYGGFETAIEEIGSRMVERGHEVTVYCRGSRNNKVKQHLGMRLVHLPAVRSKSLETLSHSALSVLHAITRRTHPDAAFVFNAANAPFVPLLRGRGIPTAVHVDGLEWKRDKWGGAAKRYYKFAESFAVRNSDALIADAQGISDYYERTFDASTELLTYGAPILEEVVDDRLAELGLTSGAFHLVVARFEPENHVDLIVEGYHASDARLPLVVVGSAPYAQAYTSSIEALASSDSRIRLLGGVWDQALLDQLYQNAATYIHGHSVGGTNPSLLRAMGAGTAVIAYDVNFNREVVGPNEQFFSTPREVGLAITTAEGDPSGIAERGAILRSRARERYDWDDVTDGYLTLATRLSTAPRRSTARSKSRVPA